jgi:tetratricopeptide (TPR) repeat protein
MTSKWVTLLAGVVVVLAALGAYHNSLNVPFLFDDESSILENPTIRQLWPIWVPLSPPIERVQGRPLVNLTLAVNYAVGGTRVRGYHAINLAIHILAGLTLLGVVRRTLLQPAMRERFGAVAQPVALAVAVIWTVHPLQTESVTYVVQRAESLMGLFYLLTLYCFIRGAESGAPGNRALPMWYVLSVTACLLGMASKEVMVTAPLMALLYDRTFVAGSFREAWRRRWPLYLALAATWLLLGYEMVSTAKGGGYAVKIPRWSYALTQLYAVAHYLRLSFWPDPLVFDYGRLLAGNIAEIAPHAVIVALLLTGALISLWRWPAIGFVGVWFFGILAPTSSVVPLANQTIAERRMYLPLAAVVTMAVVGAFVVGKKLLGRQPRLGRALGWMLAGAVVCLLAVQTIRRNFDYFSPVSIWQDTVNKCPDNARARYNLGLALFQAGRIEDSVVQYKEALRLSTDMPEAYRNLDVVLFDTGQLKDAIAYYEQGLRKRSELAVAHYHSGVDLVQAGRTADGIRQYEQALRMKSDYADVQNNLAWLLATDGDERLRDPARAVRLAERACELTARQDPAVLDTLAAAYAAAGRFNDGIQTARQAISVAGTAGQEELVKDIQGRLELYKAGQPFRRKPATAPNT